jgi:hypothetical protein
MSWSDLKNKLRQDFQGFRRDDSSAADNFQCLQQDKEPHYDYFRRFVQKKAQTPNFPDFMAIKKCIEGLLLGPLASHLSREPPTNLRELYAEMEKYARSNADHKKRVEIRKMMR